jgi:curved DNA-binding protein CbpA
MELMIEQDVSEEQFSKKNEEYDREMDLYKREEVDYIKQKDVLFKEIKEFKNRYYESKGISLDESSEEGDFDDDSF